MQRLNYSKRERCGYKVYDKRWRLNCAQNSKRRDSSAGRATCDLEGNKRVPGGEQTKQHARAFLRKLSAQHVDVNLRA